MLHCLPFQCSMKVCSTPLALKEVPTAQTSLVETLATPWSSLFPGVALGLATTLQAAACATAGASSRASSIAATTPTKRLTLKRFMMFLTLSCSLEEQVTLQQAEQRHHGDAMPACQDDGHARETIRCASNQRVVEAGSQATRRVCTSRTGRRDSTHNLIRE